MKLVAACISFRKLWKLYCLVQIRGESDQRFEVSAAIWMFAILNFVLVIERGLVISDVTENFARNFSPSVVFIVLRVSFYNNVIAITIFVY